MTTPTPVVVKQAPHRARQPLDYLLNHALPTQTAPEPEPLDVIGPLAVVLLAEAFLTAEEIAEYFDHGRIRVTHGR